MKAQTTNFILNQLQTKKDFFREMGASHLSLFGSFADGSYTDSSDVDILVSLEKKDFDTYMNLKMAMEDLFLRPVDLVLESAIKPVLKDGILKQSIHVY